MRERIIQEYTILHKVNLEDLIYMVNKYLRIKWYPLGTPFYEGGIGYYQAMLKDHIITEEDEENAKLKRLLTEACEQLTKFADVLCALGHLKKDNTLKPTEIEQWWEEHKKQEQHDSNAYQEGAKACRKIVYGAMDDFYNQAKQKENKESRHE